MPDGNGKIFSLQEADALVPLLSSLTAGIMRKLDAVRKRYRKDGQNEELDVPEPVLKEIQEALKEWSDAIVQLGAHPKGYFTVDFQSFDPELLYCWTYGEEKIAYTHKVWENFSHRRPLSESLRGVADHMRWLH